MTSIRVTLLALGMQTALAVLPTGCHNTAQGVKADTRRALDKTGEKLEKVGHKIDRRQKRCGTDVCIFQIAKNLTMSSGTSVVLTGGAVPRNVFWQVAGLTDVGTTAHLEGVVLTQTSLALRTGASINGRLLAQTAVSIDRSTVVAPTL